jgi:DNA polymerase-3 subunit gamma/tau
MSLYNKYRPKNFSDLIQNCPNSFKTNGLNHHVFLFFGPPGTGKTSCTRLAMLSQFPDVCEKDLETIISGRHPDYIEVNCAVNNGVDDIRALIADKINTLPINAQYKFIIFDEAHMLSNFSQNALLKTIEEPPKHVKFFFCTTEVNKILPAIRSRCQIIPFHKIKDQNLIQILQTVCKEENLDYEKESLDLIISCADGSARNALNLLGQCSLTLKDVNATALILGTSPEKDFYNLTKYICDKDRLNSLKLLDSIFENSIDPGSVMNKYADYIAHLIVTRITDSSKCEFEGKKLIAIGQCVTDILKDFKILQNLKLISKLFLLKTIEKI